MARYGPKLERKQLLLGRFVDVATEIFAISATCARASALGSAEATELAHYFTNAARLRIDHILDTLHRPVESVGYKIAQRVVGGEFEFLERGILEP
jgi:hypothetical protein